MSEFDDKLSEILGNQEAMGQIMALAQSLSGGKQDQIQRENEHIRTERSGEKELPDVVPESGELLSGLDPRVLQVGMRLLREYNQPDNRNAALLMALRPFVKEKRLAKVDRAVQVARLSRVIRLLFEMVKENGG